MFCRILWRMMIISLLGLLSGCATLSESECRQGDWLTIGRRDGSQGRTPDYYQQHIKACAEYGIRLRHEEYQTGYHQGLAEYCTVSNGYREGIAVEDYQRVCPAHLEPDFIRGYVDGLRQAAIRVEDDLDAARSQRRRLDDDLHEAKDPVQRKKLQEALENAASTLNSLYSRQSTIQRLINQHRERAYRD